MAILTNIFTITAPRKTNQLDVPNLVFTKRNWISKFLLCFKNFLRVDWAENLLAMAKRDKEKSAQFVSAFVQESQNKIRTIQTKPQRLLDGYLEQDIEREIYREQKTKLLMEKKSLEEQMARIEQKQNDWLELFQNWIKVASNLVKIARDSNLQEKKVSPKKSLARTCAWRAALCAASQCFNTFPHFAQLNRSAKFLKV
jgi:hypothetical protein